MLERVPLRLALAAMSVPVGNVSVRLALYCDRSVVSSKGLRAAPRNRWVLFLSWLAEILSWGSKAARYSLAKGFSILGLNRWMETVGLFSSAKRMSPWM